MSRIVVVILDLFQTANRVLPGGSTLIYMLIYCCHKPIAINRLYVMETNS
jgi:hypothetical protein